MSVRKISQVNNEDITLLDFTERRRSVSVRIGVTKMIEREVAAIASVGPVEVN